MSTPFVVHKCIDCRYVSRPYHDEPCYSCQKSNFKPQFTELELAYEKIQELRDVADHQWDKLIYLASLLEAHSNCKDCKFYNLDAECCNCQTSCTLDGSAWELRELPPEE